MELNKVGLFKVTTYEVVKKLEKGHENYPALSVLRIKVKQLISRPSSKYLAIPEKEGFMQLIQAKNEFVGEGGSEEEALNDCVEKIKDIPFSTIFPKK